MVHLRTGQSEKEADEIDDQIETLKKRLKS